MTSINYVGYHGTDSTRVASIQANNFNSSQNKNDWLGYGVYFFIDGIGCPLENACEWAINQAYHKGSYIYDEYSVLKTNIECLKVLDVTEKEGNKVFHILKKVMIDKNPNIFDRYRDTSEDNRLIWNFISKQMDLDVVINSLFIKHKEERRKKIQLNVPNSLVLCVKKRELIDSDKLELVEEKRKVK
ncbi:MAG: hypothetical protein ACJAZP_003217 [Psychromonas sp.]|jgi:hypothetical protein|uniref:hypothetical protein n=1 Tax=Psychromonas sp. TaxID=1884585 RepID=UPI0039E33A49